MYLELLNVLGSLYFCEINVDQARTFYAQYVVNNNYICSEYTNKIEAIF